MTTATVHQLPAIGDEGQDHAANVAALVDEIGRLSVELADARAALGARSDERDRWHAVALAYFGQGYRAGFDAGEVIGAERAILAWKVTATGSPALGGTPFIEADARRYPSYRPGVPSGRLSWVIVRDDERCAHEAVGLDCPDGYDGCQYGPEGGQ